MYLAICCSTIPLLVLGFFKETALHNDLMKDYHRGVPPRPSSPDPVQVSLGISVLRVDPSPETNSMSAIVWHYLQWSDERLAWRKERYGAYSIRVDISKIWAPDITLLNSEDGALDLRRIPSEAIVSHSGEVMWMPAKRVKTTCSFHGLREESCELSYSSWTFSAYELSIAVADCDTASYTANQCWDLLPIQYQRKMKWFPCCSDPFVYIDFHLRIDNVCGREETSHRTPLKALTDGNCPVLEEEEAFYEETKEQSKSIATLLRRSEWIWFASALVYFAEILRK